MTLDSFGNPAISYYDNTNGYDSCDHQPASSTTPNSRMKLMGENISYLKLAQCTDTSCMTSKVSIIAPVTGQYTSIVRVAGQPIISYYDTNEGTANRVICTDTSCSSASKSIVYLSPAIGRYQSTTLLNTTTPSYYNAFWSEGLLTNNLHSFNYLFANAIVHSGTGSAMLAQCTVSSCTSVAPVALPQGCPHFTIKIYQRQCLIWIHCNLYYRTLHFGSLCEWTDWCSCNILW